MKETLYLTIPEWMMLLHLQYVKQYYVIIDRGNEDCIYKS